MRILSWNVNHRAARHPIPGWLAASIAEVEADVVVLCEYVAGPGHEQFLGELRSASLLHYEKTVRLGRENELLIASRTPLVLSGVRPPAIHPSVPSNFLAVGCADQAVAVVGFRMPAFEGRNRPHKRGVWRWLLGQLAGLGDLAVVIGDFNTQVGDPPRSCGDCLESVQDLGWSVVVPEEGVSWRGARSENGRRIDLALVAPGLEVSSATYSWAFRAAAPEAARLRVGQPDHAMLIVEVAPRSVR